MYIRQATVADLEKVAEVFNQYRIFYGCESDLAGARNFLLERFRNLESVIFLALDEKEQCMGFTQLYPSFSSVSMKKVYILNDLYVIEAGRRKNAGTELLQTAICYGRVMGAARVTLTTEINNQIAQTVYEKNGFTYDEENKVYHCFIK